MTIPSIPWLPALVLALAACLPAGASAQTGTPVTPPARADVVLKGNMLGARQVRTQAECQMACEAGKACSGYSFYVPGHAREAPKANCALFSDATAEAPAAGVVSCRMPCAAPALAPMGRLAAKPVTTMVPMAPAPAQPAAPATLQPAAPAAAVGTSRLVARPITTFAPVPVPTPAAPPAPPPPFTPPPAPTRTAAPPTTTPATRSAVSGYEIARGPWVEVAPLSLVTTSALCPNGKVALGAGVESEAAGDASFGVEVRGAMPDARQGTVGVRNANVLVRVRARAVAVCVNQIAGLRNQRLGGAGLSAGSPAARSEAGCNASERLVGGGAMGREQTVLAANGPRSEGPTAAVWQQMGVSASPVALPGTVGIEAHALCAPESVVDGWEVVEGAEISLGGRSQVTLTLPCPSGKVLLAAGVLQRSTNLLDMVASTLVPAADGSGVSAHVHNRNTLGTGGDVRAVLAGLCARHQ
jgi:hypothetical protein